MRRSGWAAALALIACSRGSHPRASGPADAAGAGPADAANADAPAHPFAGRRAYVVTAAFTPPLRDAPLPDSHRFTLALDGDTGDAFASAPEGGRRGTFKVRDDGTVRLTGPFNFSFAELACVSLLEYDRMTLTISADGRVTGSAEGRFSFRQPEAGSASLVSATLQGAPDDEPPALTAQPGGPQLDPLLPFQLAASEALPAAASPTLTSSRGDLITLAPLIESDVVPAALHFSVQDEMLRYDTAYTVDGGQLRDFAGNEGTALTFTTPPLPPLVPEDGFESAPPTALGDALVIAGPGNPVIAGGQSLYVPPIDATGPTHFVVRVALRQRVQAGDTVLRLSYRTTATSARDVPRSSFMAGVVGKPIAGARQVLSGPTTPFVMPDGTTLLLGPTETMEIPLPGPADEVYLGVVTERLASCGPAATILPTQGLIIDDVRVE